jgi:hypothetical protein
MKMVKTKLALGAAVAALALSAGAANAAVTWTSTGLDAPLGAGETMVLDFDGTAAPGYILAGGAESSVSIPNVAAAPAGDATDFYYVIGGGSATLLTPVLLNTLSLYIGSLDDYNTISFRRGGVDLGTFNGLQLQVPANGDQGDPATNRRFYFDFQSVGGVDEIVFESEQNSFEFDNIAVSAVPEPGVWGLMIAGFGMLGAALRRRRSGAMVTA